MIVMIITMMKSSRKNSTDLNRPSVFTSKVIPSVQQKDPQLEEALQNCRTSY